MAGNGPFLPTNAACGGNLDIITVDYDMYKMTQIWAADVVKLSVCSPSTLTIRVRIPHGSTIFTLKLLLKRMKLNRNKCSDCGSVGRASDSRGPRFESSHRQSLSSTFTVKNRNRVRGRRIFFKKRQSHDSCESDELKCKIWSWVWSQPWEFVVFSAFSVCLYI